MKQRRGFDLAKFRKPISSGLLTRTFLFLVLLTTAACSSRPTPTLFVPPTAIVIPPTAVPLASPVPPTSTSVPTATAVTPTAAPCTNDLSFVQDVTIPDGTSVAPAETVDKQWLVTNTGSCNWDAGYRLKLVGGDALGVPTEQALYPARAGTQATLRIVFTSPQAGGEYSSVWQAFAPDGTAFGQTINIQIIVSS